MQFFDSLSFHILSFGIIICISIVSAQNLLPMEPPPPNSPGGYCEVEGANCTGGAICSAHVCTCPGEMVPEKGLCKHRYGFPCPGYEAKCTQGSICHHEGTTVGGGTTYSCICPDTYTFSPDYNRCVLSTSSILGTGGLTGDVTGELIPLGSPCPNFEQCEGGGICDDGTGNTEKMCNCPPGQINENGLCVTPTMSYELCVARAIPVDFYTEEGSDCFHLSAKERKYQTEINCGPNGHLALVQTGYRHHKLKMMLLDWMKTVFIGMEKKGEGYVWKTNIGEVDATPNLKWAEGSGMNPNNIFVGINTTGKGMIDLSQEYRGFGICQYRGPNGQFNSKLVDEMGESHVIERHPGLDWYNCSTLCHAQPACLSFSAGPAELGPSSTAGTCTLHSVPVHRLITIPLAGHKIFQMVR